MNSFSAFDHQQHACVQLSVLVELVDIEIAAEVCQSANGNLMAPLAIKSIVQADCTVRAIVESCSL